MRYIMLLNIIQLTDYVLGMLESDDGIVLKPCQSKGRGNRELAFYQEIFNAPQTNVIAHQLKPLISQYHGIWTTTQFENGIDFGYYD